MLVPEGEGAGARENCFSVFIVFPMVLVNRSDLRLPRQSGASRTKPAYLTDT